MYLMKDSWLLANLLEPMDPTQVGYIGLNLFCPGLAYYTQMTKILQ